MHFAHYMANALLLLLRSYQDSNDREAANLVNGNVNPISVNDSTSRPILANSKYEYSFRSVVAQGKCMEVRGGGGHNNDAVIQVYSCDGSDNQKWDVPRSATSGSVDGGALLNVDSLDCLTVHAGSSENGAAIHQFDCAQPASENQKWRIVKRADFIETGRVQIFGIVGRFGKCLTVNGGQNPPDGTPVVLWDCAAGGMNHQLWEIIR